MLNRVLLREFVFCKRMKLNKWICAKKKANGLYFYKGHDKVRKGQLNLSLIRVRNQRKFAPNPSPIWIRIPACTLVSNFCITFGSDVQSRKFKLVWKVNLKGYNFVVYQKYEF